MLSAARRRFLSESYENVGLRDVAGDAGVDVALVSRYFGSKEGLFREVVTSSNGDWLDPSVTRESLAGWLAALATRDNSEDAEDVERLLIILRSASSPKAAEIVRETFQQQVSVPMSRLISGSDPELRASLALSMVVGTTILRTIMKVDPLSRSDPQLVRARLTELLSAALAE
jgi:AcrR family transcriptional regulator